MSSRHVKPGGTPFNQLTFNNSRAKGAKFKITAVNSSGVAQTPSAMQTIAAGTATMVWKPSTNTPPLDWEDIATVTVQIFKNESSPTSLGSVPVATRPAQAPNPRPVASSAWCQLSDYVSNDQNDCTVTLYDASGNQLAANSGVIQSS